MRTPLAVAAVVRYSLLELSRRRFLLVFLILGLATAGFLEWIPSVLMDQPVVGEDRTAAILLVLSGIGPAGRSPAGTISPANVLGLCAFAIGMVIINHDLDSGSIVGILSKPISRAGYAAGKALAAALLLFGSAAFIGLCISAVIAINGQNETGLVVTFFLANAGNLMLLVLIVMTLTVYMNNVVAAVIAFIAGQVLAVLEPLHQAVTGGDITAPFWVKAIETAHAAEPFRLTTSLAHEAVTVSVRVGLLRPDGDPYASVPIASGFADILVWLIYLVLLFAVLLVAINRKEV